MQLTVEGIVYAFMPVKAFRAAHRLPPEFGISQFEAKDYTGLGRIDQAGSELNHLRETLLAMLPQSQSATSWLAHLPEMTRQFEHLLRAINPQVGLREAEIEFAVAGFNDPLQAYAYARLRGQSAPDFTAVYGEWLTSTTRLFTQRHTFQLDDAPAQAQVVAHAFGRFGLLIQAADVVHAVYDPALACPAEGFMVNLLTDIGQRMSQTSH